MKRYIFIGFCLLILSCLSSCKKDKTAETNSDPGLEKISMLLNTQEGAALKYEEILKATGDSIEALVGMGKWIIQQPDVSEAFILDDYTIEVNFKNRIRSNIHIVPVDINGKPHYRGGGRNLNSNNESKTALQLKSFSTLAKKSHGSKHLIENKKVMVYIPYYHQFYNSNYPHINKIENGKVDLDVELVTGTNADLQTLNTFSQYGLIILNTHGFPNGFTIQTKVQEFDIPSKPLGHVWSLSELQNLELMVGFANNLPLNEIESGDLLLDMDILVKFQSNDVLRSFHVLVTDKYIKKLPRLKDAIVFGNHCYSGYTQDGIDSNNLAEAWKSIGAVTYYGYAFANGGAQIVSNGFALDMEDSLITNLIKKGDSTGVAHLAGNNLAQWELKSTNGSWRSIKFKIKNDITKSLYLSQNTPGVDKHFFKQFFDPHYRYDCGDTIIDDRDQQKYPTVCIGKQVWMAKNLNWAGAGVCYDNKSSNCDIYGRMYTFKETVGDYSAHSEKNPSGVKGICPKGWHVPSTLEWTELITLAGGTVTGGKKLKSTNLWVSPSKPGTNEYGFNVLPGGYGNNGETIDGEYKNGPILFGYKNMGGSQSLWTSSMRDNGSAQNELQGVGLSGGDFFSYGSTVHAGEVKYCRCVMDK